jgi:hypothetical protein
MRGRLTAMRFLALVLPSLLSMAVNAADCTVRSGPQTAALVELYTSEGCSSCPPADKWLSSLAQPGMRPRVVPIAFHIKYWDYIGWKDAYADDRYTQRQEDLAKAFGAHSVYTPQVVLGGRDYRGWSRAHDTLATIEKINQSPARAQIELRATATADGGIAAAASAKLSAGVKADDLALFVVPTQEGLSSRVTAGENNGEHLRHSFVARDLAMAKAAGAAAFELAPTFKPKAGWDLEKMSVAAFVQNLRTGEVLQAVSGPVCRS